MVSRPRDRVELRQALRQPVLAEGPRSGHPVPSVRGLERLLPLPVCKYARSRRDKRFRGEAAWSVCAAKREKYYGFKAGVLMNSAGEIFRWWLGPANTDEREMLDAAVSAIPVRRQGADLRRLDRSVGRARCRLDDAAAGKHEGRPSAVADPAGDASAAGDRDGLPRRGLRRLPEQGPGLLEGPVPPQSPRLQPLTPVRAHLRQGMTSSSYAGSPRFGLN